MTKPIASLSLDLDNKWAYMRTHGNSGWEDYPSYFDVAVPRILRFCIDRNLRMTFFVVGRDAEHDCNLDALAALSAAGHEIGNHSLSHYPWMQSLSRAEVESEIAQAEQLIERATGQMPIGFRGPGYSFSPETLEILANRGYLYDASTLPTYIGPLARWYFRRTASHEAVKQAEQRELFGMFREGRRFIRPYRWDTPAGPIVEIPVTTFPIVKLPIHMTYLLYLWQFSPRLTKLYLRMSLAACRWFGINPSVILHPVDFLGCEDDDEMRFFPGMTMARAKKMLLVNELFDQLSSRFRLVPMEEHAKQVAADLNIHWRSRVHRSARLEQLATVE